MLVRLRLVIEAVRAVVGGGEADSGCYVVVRKMLKVPFTENFK